MANPAEVITNDLEAYRGPNKKKDPFLPSWSQGWVRIVVLLVILGGFFVRLLYLPNIYFHPDEYISLIAARAVAEQGIPLLPSGLIYNSEILFTYASGFLMGLTGQNEFMARWVGLIFGVLVIALAYVAGKRIFSSPLVGLAVTSLFAFAPEMVLWGARARRYSIIQFFVLLMLWLVWVGVIEADRRKFRLIFYGVALLAGAAGLLVLMIFPPLSLAIALLVWRRYAPKGRPQPSILLEIGLFSLIMLGLLWYASNDFIARYPAQWQANQQIEQQNPTSLVETLTAVIPFLAPKSSFSTTVAWAQEVAAAQPLYIPLSGLALVGGLLSFMPQTRAAVRLRQASRFMVILTLAVIFEFLFFVSEDWHDTRYLLGSFWPLLTILACGAIGWLQWAIRQREWPKQSVASSKLALTSITLVVVGPLIFTLPVTLNDLRHGSIKEDDYHQSFQFVADHWQPDHRIIVTTTMPPISLWYLGRADYYARLESPYVFRNSAGKWGDIWAGAYWIQEPDDLAAAFSPGQTLWLVIDDRRLYEQLPLWFRLHVFARMELAFEADNIKVFHSIPEVRPVPFAPATHLAVPLGNQLELSGFSLDESALRSGLPAMLTLFWKVNKPLPLPEAKVFVHIRDSANHTVVQADHIPSEVIMPLPFNIWPVGEVIPDVSYLTIPVNIPSGEYKLLVGIYDPKTFERLPVQNDTTGENAVVLGAFSVP